jgi:anaerobic ribonucleoside-triphosphate reductase
VAAAITRILKRNGTLVPFDREKITVAIYKAAAAVGGHDRALSEKLSAEVIAVLERSYSENPPTVEDTQDVVERVLIANGHARTAKAYIVYRHERAKMRARRRRDPERHQAAPRRSAARPRAFRPERERPGRD